jgi:hypothetical protein
VNEVIADRSNGLLGGRLSNFAPSHPGNHGDISGLPTSNGAFLTGLRATSVPVDVHFAPALNAPCNVLHRPPPRELNLDEKCHDGAGNKSHNGSDFGLC